MRLKVLLHTKLLLFALICATGLAVAQDYQIHSRVDLVMVPVTVKASGDKLIGDMTKADFSILEDNKKQEIATFSIDPVPLSVVVLLDTDLSAKSLENVQNSFPALSAAFSPFDEVAIYRFSHNVTKVQDFTSDPLRMEAAVKDMRNIEANGMPNGSGPFQSPVTMINGMPIQPVAATMGNVTTAKESKVLYDAIFQAAEDLSQHSPAQATEGNTPKRRVIIVVSDGRNAGSVHSFDDSVKRMQQANVQLYVIGVDSAAIGRHLALWDNFAKQTGGDSFFLNSKEGLDAAYARAAEEARNQYTLGYYSMNPNTGKTPVYRTIDVQSSRKGIQILYRQGYYQYPG